MNPSLLEPVIREHCPVTTETLSSTQPLEPQLGSEATRRLYTYVDGMCLNGYSDSTITANANQMFRIQLSSSDINNIISSIELETCIASMKLVD